MIFSFFLWTIVLWGLSFLVADAHIFGTSASAFEKPGFPQEPGILPIRQFLMMSFLFLRKLLECYFCMGIWLGPVVYLLLLPSPLSPWLGEYVTLNSVVILSLSGATMNYLFNLLVKVLEARSQ